VDAQCAAAVDLARSVAEELAGEDGVGEHLGVEADAERVVTHFFACLSPAYVGWRWAVTLARASRARVVTVDEAVLLPGPGALLPPEWLPWSERLRPGDLGVGDLLPTAADDPRLEPGYTAMAVPVADPDGSGAALDSGEEDAAVAWELGLGRARVLSPLGRDEAADRWYSGEHGPFAPIAAAAPAQCSTCGFFVPLAGALRRVFGVCANEYAPADGGVVSADHGCGAHSEAAVVPAPEAAGPVLDEVGYDSLAGRPGDHEPGSVDDATPAEDLGHS
jgi:Protein of unknown function (DUF3027)